MSYKHTKLLGFLLPCLLLNQAQAQNTLDLGKYTQSYSLGTARSIGFGNALGSVGGDFSTLNVNPAGIGIYRSSEFMVTPGLRFNGSNSEYNGTSTKDNNVRFGFNNIGMVFTDAATGKSYDRRNWKSTSFGIGINRLADFNRNYSYHGRNNTSSASQFFEADALQYGVEDVGYPGYMGYESYLLSDNFLTYVPYAKGINQSKYVEEKGGINELTLSLGGNYKEKLMLGATIGIPILSHKISTTTFEQTIDPLASDSFDNFSYSESLKVSGAGINLKLGAIYKFNDYFRIGAAVHTPTAYSITETSNSNISVESYLYGMNSVAGSEFVNEYSIVTPYKLIASATGMLGKYGFISVDYEYVGNNSMRFRLEDVDRQLQNRLNNMVKTMYRNASNIRAGIELRFDKTFVRGGVGFCGSPYKDSYYQTARTDISLGFGMRFDNMFLDLGIINSAYKGQEQPYVLDGSMGYIQPNSASIKSNYTNAVVTLGWKL